MTAATTKAPRAKKLVVEAIPEEPRITPAQIDEMKSVEGKTLAWLKAQPLETVHVGHNLSLTGALEVRYNGVAFSYRCDADHQMPAAIAALVRARIAANDLTSPKS